MKQPPRSQNYEPWVLTITVAPCVILAYDKTYCFDNSISYSAEYCQSVTGFSHRVGKVASA